MKSKSHEQTKQTGIEAALAAEIEALLQGGEQCEGCLAEEIAALACKRLLPGRGVSLHS